MSENLTQLDYCLVRREQINFLKDVKFLPNQKCITKLEQSVCGFKMRKKRTQESYKSHTQ